MVGVGGTRCQLRNPESATAGYAPGSDRSAREQRNARAACFTPYSGPPRAETRTREHPAPVQWLRQRWPAFRETGSELEAQLGVDRRTRAPVVRCHRSDRRIVLASGVVVDDDHEAARITSGRRRWLSQRFFEELRARPPSAVERVNASRALERAEDAPLDASTAGVVGRVRVVFRAEAAESGN